MIDKFLFDFHFKALNVYWLTSNFISIFQARLIRWDPIREKLGIPEMIKWKPHDLPMNNFSFKSYESSEFVYIFQLG